MGKKINACLGAQTILIWTYVNVSKFVIVGTDCIKVQNMGKTDNFLDYLPHWIRHKKRFNESLEYIEQVPN